MGFFGKIKSWFKGGKEDEYNEMNDEGNFDISSDDGVDELLASDSNDDFMNENLESTSESETDSHSEDVDFAPVEENYEATQEVDQSYNNESENSYYDVADQNYENSNLEDESHKSEPDYSFEADQNLTQPNEEIFMEIQNRIKLIREKTEELKRLREQNQSPTQDSKE